MNARAPFFVFAGIFLLALLLPRPAGAAWPTDPLVNVPLCSVGNNQQYPTIVSDGAGGAIITWQDYRSGIWDIYAQRISAAGLLRWVTDGVALCTAYAHQFSPAITPDVAGGAIVAWQDYRSGYLGYTDIYAQRISAAGVVQWAANGVALCMATGNQVCSTTTSDAAGGAIVAWQDFRSGTNDDIYAQRVCAWGNSATVRERESLPKRRSPSRSTPCARIPRAAVR